MIVLVTKCCCDCELNLPLSEYYERGACQAGLVARCRACSKKAIRQWEADNPFRTRDGRRARRYGLSAEDIAPFMAVPVCQSCGVSFADDHALKLDHCHCKGHVRGAICHACNMTLMGPADEALRRLESCRQYLMRDLERQREQG